MRATIEGIMAKLVSDEAKVQPDGESDLAVEANRVLDECVNAIDAASCGLDDCPTEDSVEEMFRDVRREIEEYRRAKDKVEHAFHELTGIMDNVQSSIDDLDNGGSWDLDEIASHLHNAKSHTETVRKSVAEGVLGGFSVPPKELLDRTARKAAGIVCDQLIQFLVGLHNRLNDE